MGLLTLHRGQAEPGEPCHTIGGGPVPVSRVDELVEGDAFLKTVLHGGVAIQYVTHYGRHCPAHLRTALEVGKPPALNGARCSNRGRRDGLRWDHQNPVANNGATSLANLKPLCWPCQEDKTERDRQAGLLRRRPP
jgi:hypothetical protein